MELKDAIRNRRSIRKYLDDDIPYEDILEILSLGILAPIAGNISHYYFIIVKDPEKIKKISEFAGQDFIKDANTLIIIISDDNKLKSLYGEKGQIFAIQNTAAIAENILLAATDNNIGTCWIGSFNEEGIKNLLEIPKDKNIHIIIAMGYPNEKPKEPIRPNLYDITFFEKWENKVYKPQFYPIFKNIKSITDYFKRLFEKI